MKARSPKLRRPLDHGRYVGEAALQIPAIKAAEALVILAGEVDTALDHFGEAFVDIAQGNLRLAAQELFWAHLLDADVGPPWKGEP